MSAHRQGGYGEMKLLLRRSMIATALLALLPLLAIGSFASLQLAGAAAIPVLLLTIFSLIGVCLGMLVIHDRFQNKISQHFNTVLDPSYSATALAEHNAVASAQEEDQRKNTLARALARVRSSAGIAQGMAQSVEYSAQISTQLHQLQTKAQEELALCQKNLLTAQQTQELQYTIASDLSSLQQEVQKALQSIQRLSEQFASISDRAQRMRHLAEQVNTLSRHPLLQGQVAQLTYSADLTALFAQIQSCAQASSQCAIQVTESVETIESGTHRVAVALQKSAHSATHKAHSAQEIGQYLQMLSTGCAERVEQCEALLEIVQKQVSASDALALTLAHLIEERTGHGRVR